MPSSTTNGRTGKFQTRTQSLCMCFWGERRLGVRLRRARGLMGRDEGKIATSRFRSHGGVQVCFIKVKALFWYFLAQYPL